MTATLDQIYDAILDIGDQLADVLARLDKLEAPAPAKQRPTTSARDVLSDPMYQRIVAWLRTQPQDTWHSPKTICHAATPENKAGTMYVRSRCLKLARLGVLDSKTEPELSFRIDPMRAPE